MVILLYSLYPHLRMMNNYLHSETIPETKTDQTTAWHRLTAAVEGDPLGFGGAQPAHQQCQVAQKDVRGL